MNLPTSVEERIKDRVYRFLSAQSRDAMVQIIPIEDLRRVTKNAHWLRRDERFDVVLGGVGSELLFKTPYQISRGQDPLLPVKRALHLPIKPLTGYWFKKWFGQSQTEALLHMVSGRAGI
jgi:hypothetical protein